MPSSSVRTFTDPDTYHAAIRAQQVEGVVTARGNFCSELTRVDFDRLQMQGADENLARVLNVTTTRERVGVFFATGQSQPALRAGGIALSRREIITWGSGLAGHHRSEAACRWGSVSLTQDHLIAAGNSIIGRELTPPTFPYRIRPPGPVLARMTNLHETAAHLAKSAPDILANPEVARAIEQALIEVMILSLAGGDPVDARSAHRHHHAVMRRLEEVLQASSEEPLYMTELCKAASASYRTLRDCCQEHLGMSPKRYLWLRRMHLARRALRSADAEATTVTEIATGCGFWELGRFAVAYRSLFGGSPSTALRRPPEDATPGDNAASPWKFADSA